MSPRVNRREALHTILVVDDDLSMRETIWALLHREFEVECAASCEDAITFLERHPGRVSAVLLDLGFPKHRLQGLEALSKIHARWPELPVTMITVENDATTASRCRDLGAFDYLVKGPELVGALGMKVRNAAAEATTRHDKEILNRHRAELRARRRELDQRDRELDQRDRELGRRKKAIEDARLVQAEREASRGSGLPYPAGDAGPDQIRPLDEVATEYCRRALRLCGGNKAEAAHRLAITVPTLRRKLGEAVNHVEPEAATIEPETAKIPVDRATSA